MILYLTHPTSWWSKHFNILMASTAGAHNKGIVAIQDLVFLFLWLKCGINIKTPLDNRKCYICNLLKFWNRDNVNPVMYSQSQSQVENCRVFHILLFSIIIYICFLYFCIHCFHFYFLFITCQIRGWGCSWHFDDYFMWWCKYFPNKRGCNIC